MLLTSWVQSAFLLARLGVMGSLLICVSFSFQVARIHESSVEADKNASTKLDLRQPFLLYKSYMSLKVHAKSVQRDSRAKMKEVGPMVVIPEDYTGWFSIVTDNRRTAPFFTSIQQVAMSQVPYFLIRTDVPAYRVSDPRLIAGRTSYTRTTIKTGHVLKLLGVYEDINAKHYKNLNRNFQRRSSTTPAPKYAQCVNYKGEVLFLSFAAQGKFYATATRGSRSVNHVYLISHILKTFKLPVTVRLVCGFLPKVPCNFTGTLKLQSTCREDIILACTLLKERNVMFEMDANSGFTLTKAEVPVSTAAYIGALAFCADEADIWQRQMKVVHHVYPQEQTTPPNSTKASTSQSSGSGSGSGSSKNQRKSSFTGSGIVQHETQSVCVSMIFDDMDEEETSCSGDTNPKPKSAATKFWTLRRLKQLAQNEPQYEAPYAVIRAKSSSIRYNEVVNDGSENANAEFMSGGWLKDGLRKWYSKLPKCDLLPENGTYVVSQMTGSDSVIYDSIA
uniref:CABIT domain-containing protein n=1 Tax=Strigamia maritima TaxID=126957 RepID=T1JD72_STRMM